MFSSDPELEYLTPVTQQRLVPTLGACLVYKPHRAFYIYLSDSGRNSIISERAEPINSLIPDILNFTLSQDPDSPLHTSPFNIVSNMTRSSQDKLPDFLQYEIHTKIGKYIA